MKGLSSGLKAAWETAASEASAVKAMYVEEEHMLIGIWSLEKSARLLAASNPNFQKILTENAAIENILKKLEINSTALRHIFETVQQVGTCGAQGIINYSEACKQILNRANELSLSNEITCLHFLVAVLEKPNANVKLALTNAGVNIKYLRDYSLLYITPRKDEPDRWGTDVLKSEDEPTFLGTPFLDKYGRDLTQEAKEGKLGPIIGREKELLQLVQTIARKNKNNPVILGEAGVGKTAVVEALAILIAQESENFGMEKKRIIELKMGTLLSGAKFRGIFEERINKILIEAQLNPEVILFFDEVHTVVGAGGGEGSMDAANLLKPALARGSLRCIGATTIKEYRRYIENDSALERRFEKILVSEPSRDETLKILQGLRSKFQEYHGVLISDEALEASIDLSVRFDGEHQLPDKAIDLIDRASVYTRIPTLKHKTEPQQHLSETESFNNFQPDSPVTVQTVAKVVSEKSGVPIEIVSSQLGDKVQSRLLELEEYLKNRLFGQDKVIETVCQQLLIAHAGINKRRGPLAIFFFLGPTGVGKTELAKLLAEYLFGSKSSLIRLDMSEYMQEHNVAKLIGSPPGYVGYEKEGQLTGKLRTNPYSIVLLDEIEKADPKVLDLFLQVFDDGRLTDSKGCTADAKNAIFIMTSNLNLGPIDTLPSTCEQKEKDATIRTLLSQVMRPEFTNRIDHIIVFEPLNQLSIKRILTMHLDELNANLKKQYNVELKIGKNAEDYLINTGYSPRFGARELLRIVQQLVEAPLSRLILKGEVTNHRVWEIALINKEISIIPVVNPAS